MKHLGELTAVAIGCMLLFVALPLVADSQVRIVRLSNLQGEVRLDRQTGQGMEKAILNMPITQGMSLHTGPDGRAEVEFEDGTVIQTAPASAIAFDQLSLRSSGDKVSTVAVRQGTAYFNVRRKGHDEFSISLPGRVVPIPKQARFRVMVNNDTLRLAAFNNDLWVPVDSGGQIKIKKGEELTLNLADNKSLLATIAPVEFDTWARQRTEYHDRYFAASSYKSYPYYGRGDLALFGGWYDIAGYGPIWRPNNVAYGWDPFSNGYWTWYPGSGYMWVSGYPWGWLPYRYGSWAYISGWGWGWVPYGNWRSWRPSPGVINKPPDYQRPQPPSGPKPPQTSVYVDNSPRGPHRGPHDGHDPDGSSAALPRPTPPSSPVVKLPPARPPHLERKADGFVAPPKIYGEGAGRRYPSDAGSGALNGGRNQGGNPSGAGLGAAGHQQSAARPLVGAAQTPSATRSEAPSGPRKEPVPRASQRQ